MQCYILEEMLNEYLVSPKMLHVFTVIMRITTHSDECDRVLPFEVSPAVGDTSKQTAGEWFEVQTSPSVMKGGWEHWLIIPGCIWHSSTKCYFQVVSRC